MAKKITWPLGVFTRQQLTLKGTTPENWKELARAARASGAIADAAEFAAEAEDAALLGEMENEAIEAGDLFNYQALCRAQDKPAEPTALAAILRAAESRGLANYAGKARAMLPQSEAKTEN